MIVMITAGFLFTACGGKSTVVTAVPQPVKPETYSLERVFEVDGRQGVASDGEHYYVSGSTSLFKYSLDGELIMSEEDPFREYKVPANHIGDIDVFEGELFLSIEWFVDGQGKDIQIAVHDAETLQFKRSFPFASASGQQEVSGITVDRQGRRIWMCSWVGGDSGRFLYEYELDSGAYLGKMELDQPPQWVQGVFFMTAGCI